MIKELRDEWTRTEKYDGLRARWIKEDAEHALEWFTWAILAVMGLWLAGLVVIVFSGK